ncbi:DegT/DnrJ/EryC1/StrS family aminotransferase [Pirellulaceae bacterium SH501]
MAERSIRVAVPVLDGNEAKYVMNCLEETWISSRGKYISQFEASLAAFLGVKDVVVTNNGTTSLHLAMVALGIQPGDEVIMPTLSYVATANAAKYCGAEPVFVDCESKYLSMDPDQIESAITPKTKAIMPVPLYGHPVDIAAIESIAAKHGLFVIEDSAEALGAKAHGKMVGAFGNCASFSFFGNKIITTGEGGALSTNDQALADRMRFLRGQAVDPNKNYWHTEVGYNYRMTNIAAAIGVAQMERINFHLAKRRQVARWYNEMLAPFQDLLQLPTEASWAEHSYWMYTVLMRPEVECDRDAWMKQLSENGVETRPIFYPIHTMPAFHGALGDFPVAESCAARGINLPTHGRLSRSDVEYVSEQVVSTLKSLYRRDRSRARVA